MMSKEGRLMTSLTEVFGCCHEGKDRGPRVEFPARAHVVDFPSHSYDSTTKAFARC